MSALIYSGPVIVPNDKCIIADVRKNRSRFDGGVPISDTPGDNHPARIRFYPADGIMPAKGVYTGTGRMFLRQEGEEDDWTFDLHVSGVCFNISLSPSATFTCSLEVAACSRPLHRDFFHLWPGLQGLS